MCAFLPLTFGFIVNITNATKTTDTLMWSYCGATTGAIVTAMSLNRLAPRFPPLVGRYERLLQSDGCDQQLTSNSHQ